MNRLISFILVLLLGYSNSAYAGIFLGGVAYTGVPSFVLDFTQSTTLDSRLTFTRSSTRGCFNSSGLYVVLSNNVPCLDYGTYGSTTLYGVLIEPGTTNAAHWNRDLTNAAWIKTNATAALNLAGIDGAANSSSTLTATGANGTALQTYTNGASNVVFAVWLKRITGTGTVNITVNNGTTWTPVVLTSTWTRFLLPYVSVANPTFGVQITTSGDAVGVDGAQLEFSTVATSTIMTTSANFGRSEDDLGVTSTSWINTSTGTIYAEGQISNLSFPGFVSFSDGTITNEVFMASNISGYGGNTPFMDVENAGTSLSATSGTCTLGAICKIATSYGGGSFSFSGNGAAVGTVSSAFPATATTVNIGHRYASSQGFVVGWIRKIRYWNYKKTNTQLQLLTQ